jgi:two-component system cell cycle response regulator
MKPLAKVRAALVRHSALLEGIHVSERPASLKELLKRSDRLPTLPAVALKILEVARKEDVTVSEMEKVISADPPLAAKVLRIVNSPFYSLPRKVTSVRQAISLLGVNSVKNLALGFSLVRSNNRSKASGFDYTGFWKKSIITAVAAKLLARQGMSQVSGEDCFFLGLLEDIGVLAVNQAAPKPYADVLRLKRDKKLAQDAAEREVLGFDHAEAGSFLIESWGLPAVFHQPIRYHHEPECQDNQALKALTHLLATAAAIADFFSDERPLEALGVISESARRRDMEGEIEQLMIRVFSEAVALGTIFDMDMSRQKSYAEILEEANYELDKNSLLLQKTIMEQAKENEQLKEQAIRDGLTGLHNHRCFHELLERELDRAQRYGRPLALILGDLDKFKDVNDTYGHQMGDQVLTEVARLFQRTLRKSDFVARYGGEEFAVLLVETSFENALHMAEKLRELTGSLTVHHAEHQARVTISFGVTALEPAGTAPNKEEMIRLADEALYEAKRCGRNRCCSRLPQPQRVPAPKRAEADIRPA